jgi:lipopolysaccharide/colanic/teichoic acid biosynthesis glycosyltransferase
MTKRVLDLLLASVLLLVTLPITLVAAVGSAIVLRAWPFFVQRRTGLDGRPFRFLKIRTLPKGTPAALLKDELSTDDLPAFSRGLRRLHFDELPQLLLVLAGKMSLVGPRPEMVEFHDRLDAGFAAERTSVLPGCTGLWQISAGCTGLIGDAPEYDRFYLNHEGLRLDLWILGKTVRMMLGNARLVHLNDIPEWAAPEAVPTPVPAAMPATVLAPARRELELAEVID